MIQFTQYNYPKQFGSLLKNSYRLKDYLHFEDAQLEEIFHSLEHFVLTQVESRPPRREYKHYEYIGSGFEWSTFRYDDRYVIKIPAGVFEEVNSPQYFENTEYAYGVLQHYYGKACVPHTIFERDVKMLVIKQELIEGLLDYYVPFQLDNKLFLEHLRNFARSTKKILDDLDWIPDIEIRKEERGFLLKNVICEHHTFLPKIIDFTYYLDPFRIYPAMTRSILPGMHKRIDDFQEWIESRLREL